MLTTAKRSGGPLDNSLTAWLRIHAPAREAPERGVDTGLVTHEVGAFERLDVEEDLGGERLVDLPQGDVGVTQSVAGQKPRDRERRRHEQPLRPEIDRGDLPIDQ